MNIADLPDESDSSDEDYVPAVKTEDVPSEVDSDGDPEDPLSDTEDVGKTTSKRKKRPGKSKKKLKTLDVEEKNSQLKKPDETEEEKKKKADSLWADFMKDTGFKSKSRTNGETSSDNVDKQSNKVPTTRPQKPQKDKEEKVKITQVFQFAGEDVKIEKEVTVDSAEARLAGCTTSSSLSSKNSKTQSRGGLKGIGSVLNRLGKKPKITTLEKSKLDWDEFKKQEKIEDELEAFRKGKDGYLEKQDFLQRADLRTFEIEKEIRNIERNKRMNMSAPM